MAPGCSPSAEKALRNAADASYRVPGAVDDLVNKIRAGRDSGVLSADLAKDLGGLLEPAARATVVFAGLVKAANEAYDRGETVPAAKFAEMKMIFDLQIIEPFLRVLEKAQILSGDSVQLILLAVLALRTLLASIGRSFNSKKAASMPEIVTKSNPPGLAVVSWRFLQWQQF
jgi:hypothetical protein